MGCADVDTKGRRRFHGARKVRLGDVDPAGRLRLDALTRYTQDVSDDDTTDAGLAPSPAWVVRRTRVEALAPAALGETLSFTTFCSGLGRRWAERHLSVVGDLGAVYEVSTLWICVDPTSGRPCPLTEQFLTTYGPAAEGRRVTARLTHPKPVEDAATWPWPLRAVDFDTLGHVNNAAYWAVVEEALAGSDQGAGSRCLRASIEYGEGLEPVDAVTILDALVDVDGPARALWWMGQAGTVAASALIELSA
jgi:acyl-ACP thioesterase